MTTKMATTVQRSQFYVWMTVYIVWFKVVSGGPGSQNSVSSAVWNLSAIIRYHNPDTETRQRDHKKRKLQADITDEHRRRNPQQNTSNPNPTIH